MEGVCNNNNNNNDSKTPEWTTGLDFNDAKSLCRVTTVMTQGVAQAKPLAVEVVDAIAKNVEITQKILNQTILPSLPVLPFPCFVSPWSILLRPKDPEKPYIPSRTTTLISIWTLYEFLFCYRAAINATNDVKIKTALTAAVNMKIEQDAWINRVHRFLNEFFTRMKQAGITEPQHKDATKCMYDFSSALFDYTMDFIHLLETRVHACACIVAGTDKIPCYKTRIDKSFIPRANSEKTLAQETLFMVQWFSQKQLNATASAVLAEAEEKRSVDAHKGTPGGTFDAHKDTLGGAVGGGSGSGDPKDVPIPQIRTNIITQIIEKQRGDPRHVLGEFIPYATLWEYAKFMDTDKILQ